MRPLDAQRPGPAAQITLRLTVDELAAVDAWAAREGMSRSAAIRSIIAAAVAPAAG